MQHPLCELHWLLNAYRVDFKIPVFTYKALHNDMPVYLCEFMCPYQPARALHSGSSHRLEVKCSPYTGDGLFTVTAASLWNTLPTVVKTCDNYTRQFHTSTEDTFLLYFILVSFYIFTKLFITFNHTYTFTY